MSRKVDMNNLSKEDVLYLQERGKRPADVEAVEVSPPEPLSVDEMPNTGDVGLPSDQSEAAFNNQVEIEDNYDEIDVDALKEEIDRRNTETENDENVDQISKSGRKAELIARLREDDQRRAAAGELEEG